jgi:hypothetical protein
VPEIPDQPEDQKRDEEIELTSLGESVFLNAARAHADEGTSKTDWRRLSQHPPFRAAVESAYRAGREDAARDIEESTAEDLDLPAWARPGGRPPPERLQEWAAYIGLRAWAASIARGTDRPTPRQGSGVVQPVEERQP